MMYFIGWSLFLIFFKLYLGFRVIGRRNVPKKGPFIFASNHTSYFDPILLGTSVYRSLNYMARDDLFKRPFFGWIMRGVHSFSVKRSESDFEAVRTALGILRAGKSLVIFPEGMRSKDNNLKRGKPGVGFLVSKTRVPVVPAYIEGSFETLPRGPGTLRRHQVNVYIGRPIDFNEICSVKKGRGLYQEISDRIMEEVARLKETYANKIS